MVDPGGTPHPDGRDRARGLPDEALAKVAGTGVASNAAKDARPAGAPRHHHPGPGHA